jgi:hypothetical protein
LWRRWELHGGAWPAIHYFFFGETLLDFSKKPQQVDRLGIEVGASHLDTLISVCRERMRSERDDWNICGSRIGLNTPGSLPPVHRAQRDIHQDQIRNFRSRHGNAAGTVGGAAHLKAAPFEPPRQHIAIGVAIFDQQNLGRRC